MKLRRTNDVSQILALHAKCFPGDEVEEADAHWILWDEETPIGFCSASKLAGEPGTYLSRVGVIPNARGSGLGKRMIRAWLSWSRREGSKFAVTYCLTSNGPSIKNLLDCGFVIYVPEYPWVGTEGCLYFHKYVQ